MLWSSISGPASSHVQFSRFSSLSCLMKYATVNNIGLVYTIAEYSLNIHSNCWLSSMVQWFVSMVSCGQLLSMLTRFSASQIYCQISRPVSSRRPIFSRDYRLVFMSSSLYSLIALSSGQINGYKQLVMSLTTAERGHF